MFKKIFILCLVSFYAAQSACADNGPLLVAVLMIKNESNSIVPTLKPLVEGGIKDFVIFDTGSTDGTQKKVYNFFAQHKQCKVYVLEEPFVNFAVSRNRALDYASQKFPHATFMLMPDSEWFLHGVPELLAYCERMKHDTANAYLIRIADAQTEFYTARLLRCSEHARYEGVVHEQLNKQTRSKVPDVIYFEWAPSKRGQEQTEQRWKRDLQLLLGSYKKDPKNARTVFYLGQTYAALGDVANACKFYTKRTKMTGYDEEDYLARYRLGVLATDWPTAMHWFLEAHNYRPERAEPLVCIAAHYYHEKNMALCYVFAERACSISYPDDCFCVDKFMYDFARYDLLGASAIAVDKLDKGEWAVHKALEAMPNMPHLQSNLAMYKANRS